MSDNCSHSTRDSVDFNSYSNTSTDLEEDEDVKSMTSAYSSNNVYTDDYTFRQVESSEDEERSGYCTTTEELEMRDDDEVPTLPIRSRSGAQPQRTRSDLSHCTTQSGQIISSSVSSFLSAVDNTVDKVVDALIPLEPKANEDETRSVSPGKKRFPAPVALKKNPFGSFGRKRNDESSVSKSVDDRSLSSSKTSLSVRSFRKKKIEKESAEKNDDSSSKNMKRFSSRWINNENVTKDVKKIDLREKSVKVDDQKNIENADTKRTPFLLGKRNESRSSVNDAFALSASSRLPSSRISTGLKSKRNENNRTKSLPRFNSTKDITDLQMESSPKKKPSKFNWKKKEPEEVVHIEKSNKNESALDVFFKGMGFQANGSEDLNFLFEEEKKKKKLFRPRKKKSEKQSLLQRKTKRGYIRNE